MTAASGYIPRRSTTEEAAETIAGVITDLTGIARRLPVPESDTAQVAAILGRLAQEVAESQYLIKARPGDPPSPQPACTRVRDLVAEHHQPLTIAPGDVRTLLARFQHATAELLKIIDDPAPSVAAADTVTISRANLMTIASALGLMPPDACRIN